jgi:hypothetical protein
MTCERSGVAEVRHQEARQAGDELITREHQEDIARQRPAEPRRDQCAIPRAHRRCATERDQQQDQRHQRLADVDQQRDAEELAGQAGQRAGDEQGDHSGKSSR